MAHTILAVKTLYNPNGSVGDLKFQYRSLWGIFANKSLGQSYTAQQVNFDDDQEKKKKRY